MTDLQLTALVQLAGFYTVRFNALFIYILPQKPQIFLAAQWLA
jgi:hypothetical protein